ncbi:MAG: Gmad2 immunoglobulin-like domain-containing protein [Chloroflexota bacterium]
MTDERRDDEIIGRALSRAIETIDVNQTPYERSRIATAPARRSIFGVWQIAGGIVAIVLAIAIGSWFTRPTDGQPGVAASPSASAGATPAPTTTPAPDATATVAPMPDHQRVYFARDGLPPIGVHVQMAQLPTVDERVGLRLGYLLVESPPAGAFSAVPGRPDAHVFTPVPVLGTVRVNGDLATVDFSVDGGDWKLRGSAATLALLQQLVYTATEEPGIRRVLITTNGKATQLDQLVIDKPLSREDVFGYGLVGSQDSIAGGEGNDGQVPALTTQWSVDSVAPGLARFVIQVAAAPGATAALPLFRVDVTANDEANKPEGGKWRYSVTVTNGADQTTHAIVDRSPLRAVGAYPGKGDGKSTIYELGLDDLRPWRVFTLSNPTRIVLDIGGTPQSVGDRIAVYQPRPGATVTRDLQLTGAARAFEASVSWRLNDSSGREVASGHFLASLGSSAVWGTFDTRITIPASVSGNVTLELFEASAKDGSPQGVVQIPLAVR